MTHTMTDSEKVLLLKVEGREETDRRSVDLPLCRNFSRSYLPICLLLFADSFRSFATISRSDISISMPRLPYERVLSDPLPPFIPRKKLFKRLLDRERRLGV